MKKLITFTLFTFLIMGFSSCLYNDTEPNRFVVMETRKQPGMINMTSYKLRMLDASGLGMEIFWVVDSIDKYKIGDRLVLQPLR